MKKKQPAPQQRKKKREMTTATPNLKRKRNPPVIGTIYRKTPIGLREPDGTLYIVGHTDTYHSKTEEHSEYLTAKFDLEAIKQLLEARQTKPKKKK